MAVLISPTLNYPLPVGAVFALAIMRVRRVTHWRGVVRPAANIPHGGEFSNRLAGAHLAVLFVFYSPCLGNGCIEGPRRVANDGSSFEH